MKECISGRQTDADMEFATILKLFIAYLWIEWIAIASWTAHCLFTGAINTISTSIVVESGGGGKQQNGRWIIKTENDQIVLVDVFFSSTYHNNQLNPWPTLPGSCVVI